MTHFINTFKSTLDLSVEWPGVLKYFTVFTIYGLVNLVILVHGFPILL